MRLPARALRWRQEKQAGLSAFPRAQLSAFRAEAAALLGLDAPPTPPGREVWPDE
jgi:hypothetical protein